MERTFLCDICGEFTIGWGHNAEPVVKDGRCCDRCNKEVVIPKRLEELEKKKKSTIAY